jgi:hypothetical protein
MADRPLSRLNPARQGDSKRSQEIPPQTERPRTPSIERERRMREENARLEKLDQRARDIEAEKKNIPDALKEYQWENYKQTLAALKTMNSNTREYRKLEEILNFYDRRIEDEKKYVAEVKKLEEEAFRNMTNFSSSSSSLESKGNDKEGK